MRYNSFIDKLKKCSTKVCSTTSLKLNYWVSHGVIAYKVIKPITA